MIDLPEVSLHLSTFFLMCDPAAESGEQSTTVSASLIGPVRASADLFMFYSCVDGL